MTDAAAAAAPAVPEPPDPAPHESPVERVENWFRHDAPKTSGALAGLEVPAGADLAALVRAHAPGFFRAFASAVEKAEAAPEVKALLPELLPVAESVIGMLAGAL